MTGVSGAAARPWTPPESCPTTGVARSTTLWESYLDYDCGHAFCNGHLLRELIFLWQEQDQKWAKSMIDHLLGIKDAVATARTAGLAALPDADLDRFLK